MKNARIVHAGIMLGIQTGVRALLALVLAASGPLGKTDTAQRLAQSTTLSSLSQTDLELRIAASLGDAGSLSIGEPNGGLLINGVLPPEGALFRLVTPEASFGTAETIAFLVRAVDAVHKAHPGTPPLHVGHLSAPGGGHLRPHRSHQSGRDVDLGFFYLGEQVWYRRATPTILDLPRNWALISSLLTETDIEMILVDRSLHAALRDEGKRQGATEAYLDSVFKGGSGLPPIIRHARGHLTHFHLRFWNQLAQNNASRAYSALVKDKKIQPVYFTQSYRAKKGDTLGKVAARFGASVADIKRANGLRTSLIVVGRSYVIPRATGAPHRPRSVTVPARRLPNAPPRVTGRSVPTEASSELDVGETEGTEEE